MDAGCQAVGVCGCKARTAYCHLKAPFKAGAGIFEERIAVGDRRAPSRQQCFHSPPFISLPSMTGND